MGLNWISFDSGTGGASISKTGSATVNVSCATHTGRINRVGYIKGKVGSEKKATCTVTQSAASEFLTYTGESSISKTASDTSVTLSFKTNRQYVYLNTTSATYSAGYILLVNNTTPTLTITNGSINVNSQSASITSIFQSLYTADLATISGNSNIGKDEEFTFSVTFVFSANTTSSTKTFSIALASADGTTYSTICTVSQAGIDSSLTFGSSELTFSATQTTAQQLAVTASSSDLNWIAESDSSAT